ncbi:phosphate signaling complex protein PhoU [Sphingosinicellaceae bacterium]|nr:phosphate signaling complex protein PhoU [Sphingosinicellaceae bacterium]
MTSTAPLPHTVSSYDSDLLELRSIVGQMGALAESQLTAAFDALTDRDVAAALAVTAIDDRIDTLQEEAERAATGIFSRHSPLADDLREVMASLKIAGWLERVGDYAKNIAKRAVTLAQLPESSGAGELVELAALAKRLLRIALAAYLERDIEMAHDAVQGDAAIDREYSRVFERLVTLTAADIGAATGFAHLQFIAKNLERIADQATNIAEQVGFAISGAPVARREKADGLLGDG